MTIPLDLHSNPQYWQEYDCPQCGQDMDVSPIPARGATIECSCGAAWPAWSHDPNTYVIGSDGQMVCINLD